MPGTAREVAGWINLPYQESRLTRDGQYNMKLGAAYISRLLYDHRGAYVLAVAAYNAGPGRVRGWVETYGDPRDPRVDMIDWIEQIPIEETRNYVQRVLESVQVYRQRLNSGHVPMQLEADLARGSYAAAGARRDISG
jgi:soluble lytic murein transglycosylase